MAMPAEIAHTTSAANHSTNEAAPDPDATTSPRKTKGKASPSFRPASEVRANAGSPWSPSPGAGTPRSPARTGSVGASAAASTIAAPSESPIPQKPRAATATIVTGITTPRRSRVVRHSRSRRAWSIRRPVAKSATITESSLSRSSTSASPTAVNHGASSSATPTAPRTPIVRYTIAGENERPLWWLSVRIATSTASPPNASATT